MTDDYRPHVPRGVKKGVMNVARATLGGLVLATGVASDAHADAPWKDASLTHPNTNITAGGYEGYVLEEGETAWQAVGQKTGRFPITQDDGLEQVAVNVNITRRNTVGVYCSTIAARWPSQNLPGQCGDTAPGNTGAYTIPYAHPDLAHLGLSDLELGIKEFPKDTLKTVNKDDKSKWTADPCDYNIVRDIGTATKTVLGWFGQGDIINSCDPKNIRERETVAGQDFVQMDLAAKYHENSSTPLPIFFPAEEVVDSSARTAPRARVLPRRPSRPGDVVHNEVDDTTICEVVEAGGKCVDNSVVHNYGSPSSDTTSDTARPSTNMQIPWRNGKIGGNLFHFRVADSFADEDLGTPILQGTGLELYATGNLPTEEVQLGGVLLRPSVELGGWAGNEPGTTGNIANFYAQASLVAGYRNDLLQFGVEGGAKAEKQVGSIGGASMEHGRTTPFVGVHMGIEPDGAYIELNARALWMDQPGVNTPDSTDEGPTAVEVGLDAIAQLGNSRFYVGGGANVVGQQVTHFSPATGNTTDRTEVMISPSAAIGGVSQKGVNLGLKAGPDIIVGPVKPAVGANVGIQLNVIPGTGK